MASLAINLGYSSRVVDSVNRTIYGMNSLKDNYEKIIQKSRVIPSSTNNLSNSNYYIKKKKLRLQGKVDKLNYFKNKVAVFTGNVAQADKRVAMRIKSESNVLYKTLGIATGFIAGTKSLIRATIKKVKDISKVVKKFYENHKSLQYLLQIGKDLIGIVGQVLSMTKKMIEGDWIGAIVGTWGLINKVFTTGEDLVALGVLPFAGIFSMMGRKDLAKLTYKEAQKFSEMDGLKDIIDYNGYDKAAEIVGVIDFAADGYEICTDIVGFKDDIDDIVHPEENMKRYQVIGTKIYEFFGIKGKGTDMFSSKSNLWSNIGYGYSLSEGLIKGELGKTIWEETGTGGFIESVKELPGNIVIEVE